MPRKPGIPRKHFHSASNQWRIRIGGHDFYLGAGREEADREEARLVGDWLRRGGHAAPPRRNNPTIASLCACFLAHRERLWQSRVERTPPDQLPQPCGLAQLRMAVKWLLCHHGDEPADLFHPRKLRRLLVEMAVAGLARSTIALMLSLTRRIWEWAEREEMVPEGVYAPLLTVRQALAGDEAGRVPEPILSVPWGSVETVLKIAPPDVAAMIRLQHLAGMRPEDLGRLCRAAVTPEAADLWLFLPSWHKTRWRGRGRKVWFGPQAIAILTPLLPAEPREPVFPGFSSNAYRHKVRRLCLKAGVPSWAPNRLRHSRATEVRKRYGLEGSASVLGDTLEVAKVYAEQDQELAKRIAREMG